MGYKEEKILTVSNIVENNDARKRVRSAVITKSLTDLIDASNETKKKFKVPSSKIDKAGMKLFSGFKTLFFIQRALFDNFF